MPMHTLATSVSSNFQCLFRYLALWPRSPMLGNNEPRTPTGGESLGTRDLSSSKPFQISLTGLSYSWATWLYASSRPFPPHLVMAYSRRHCPFSTQCCCGIPVGIRLCLPFDNSYTTFYGFILTILSTVRLLYAQPRRCVVDLRPDSPKLIEYTMLVSRYIFPRWTLTRSHSSHSHFTRLC